MCDFTTVVNVPASCKSAIVIAPVSRGWLETSAVPVTTHEEGASTVSGSTSFSFYAV